MTDPLTAAVAVATGVCALAAGFAFVPRPPVLDGERLFKVTLCTLLRGVVEARGGDAAAWEAEVVRHVPYHPAGRLPEQKLQRPEGFVVGGDALGEPAVLDALRARDTVDARYRFLFEEDEAGLVARLSDPAELGPTYDPGRVLGSVSWDTVADAGAGASAALQQALSRSLAATHVTVGEDVGPPVLEAARVLTGATALPTTDLGASLPALVTEPASRLVIWCASDAAAVVLRTLAASGGLRDRVLAVVFVGGNLGGREGSGPLGAAAMADWNDANFTDAVFDLEANRSLFLFSVQWLDTDADPLGFDGLRVERQRLVQPRRNGVHVSLQPVDLGVLPPHDDLPVREVALALWTTVAMWVAG